MRSSERTVGEGQDRYDEEEEDDTQQTSLYIVLNAGVISRECDPEDENYGDGQQRYRVGFVEELQRYVIDRSFVDRVEVTVDVIVVGPSTTAVRPRLPLNVFCVIVVDQLIRFLAISPGSHHQFCYLISDLISG